ncbi:type II toxin-antitoxin system RelE/ParE family toxin [Rhodococcus erythropolis]|uniref:type II toxin-antitoxin system RelE family toxin n=1 Tax=Rhodococcus erythropolis TaxID=1833 RepID=UPI0029492E1F|nr:type II toxin-antitoxin system RelE/ParE family toxin [Rhodococcus erythropolis]MDV6278604.1 type II toxin-antitoxin system RelE/ParE family toxin [Rhodococcus erythropolis]
MSDRLEPYRLVLSRTATKALTTTLPEKIASAVYEFLTSALMENPRRVGKPLQPPLSPAYSARRGTYRVIYLVDDAARTVHVTAISHRADAYRRP